MQGWTATTRHGFTTKRSAKRLKHTGNISRYWNEINNEINTECLQYYLAKTQTKKQILLLWNIEKR